MRALQTSVWFATRTLSNSERPHGRGRTDRARPQRQRVRSSGWVVYSRSRLMSVARTRRNNTTCNISSRARPMLVTRLVMSPPRGGFPTGLAASERVGTAAHTQRPSSFTRRPACEGERAGPAARYCNIKEEAKRVACGRTRTTTRFSTLARHAAPASWPVVAPLLSCVVVAGLRKRPRNYRAPSAVFCLKIYLIAILNLIKKCNEEKEKKGTRRMDKRKSR